MSTLSSSFTMPNYDPRHTTLRDVAKLSGVSAKTVSRTVNNQGEVSDSTRSRVQAAIEQTGYRPNILARNLVNQRTDTLGVVAWGIDYYGPSRALLAFSNNLSNWAIPCCWICCANPTIGTLSRYWVPSRLAKSTELFGLSLR